MSSTAYTTSHRTARQSCQDDPLCVGFSESHLFYSDTVLERATPVYMVRDSRGSQSYVKDLYPTVFL
jgi:hypothetical protein